MEIPKNIMDFKSLAIGFLLTSLLFVSFSFKSVNDNFSENPNQRYQTDVSENKIVILDTWTGEFVMDRGIRVDEKNGNFVKFEFKEIPMYSRNKPFK